MPHFTQTHSPKTSIFPQENSSRSFLRLVFDLLILRSIQKATQTLFLSQFYNQLRFFNSANSRIVCLPHIADTKSVVSDWFELFGGISEIEKTRQSLKQGSFKKYISQLLKKIIAEPPYILQCPNQPPLPRISGLRSQKIHCATYYQTEEIPKSIKSSTSLQTGSYSLSLRLINFSTQLLITPSYL